MLIPRSRSSGALGAWRASTAGVQWLFFSDIRLLAGLTWKRVGLTFALAVALGAVSAPVDVLHRTGRLDAPVEAYLSGFLLCWFPNHLVPVFALMLLGTLADNLPLRGVWRVAAFGAALALGIYLITPLYCSLLAWEWRCNGFPSWTYFGILPMFNGVTLFFVPLAIVVGTAVACHRRGAAIAGRLHAASMERIELERQTVQSRLQAMQARLDPAFLHAMLARVSARCVDNPERAEYIVDGLVRHLRATLPDAATTGSTLGRELQVAGTYLELARLFSDGRLRYDMDAPEELSGEVMAPALLMPLIMCLLPGGDQDDTRGAPIAAGDEGGGDIHVAVSAHATTLSLAIVATGRGFVVPDSDALADVRARLREVHGTAASLRVESTGAAQVFAVLVVPRQSGPVPASRIARTPAAESPIGAEATS